MQTVHLSWAMDRFEKAGLTLPPLEVTFHPDRTPCAGHRGTTTTTHLPITISICIDHTDQTALRDILLHELTHAWDLGTEALPPETHAQFLQQRGLTDWNDQTQDWPYRGAEHAAEIITWGLRQTETGIATRIGSIGPQDTQSLTLAFETLTGIPPLWTEN